MAGIFTYSKKLLVNRIQRHVANGFPNDSFPMTPNEILLYIDEALAFNMVGQVWANAKVEGNMAVPEAYLTTYALDSLAQDSATGYWYTTLPQPPVSLPLGYSIDRCYFAMPGSGESTEVMPIKANRMAIRKNMPLPPGSRYWTENNKIWISATDGTPLGRFQLYVRMVKTRTDDMFEVIALPDDAIEGIFNSVVQKIVSRYGLPQDVVKDNLPAGNKTS